MLRRILIAVLFCSRLRGETAVLPSMRDACAETGGTERSISVRKAAVIDFRFSIAANWRIAKANLLLHVAEGRAPSKIGIAVQPADWQEAERRLPPQPWKFLSHAVIAMPDDWIRIEVSPALVELLSAGKGFGLVLRDSSGRLKKAHARESGQFAPYLIVDGSPR